MKKILVSISALSAYALCFFGYQMWTSQFQTGFKPAPDAVFPQKSSQSVHLPRDKGIYIAYVNYKTIDNRRIKTTSTSYWNEVQDNVVETANYYLNGFMKESQKIFPSGEGETQVVRRHATYSDDGYFTYHKVNRKNGTCERIGQKLVSGDYNTRYFFEDGVNIKRDRLFNPTQADPSGYRLSTEKVMRINGSLEQEVFMVESSYYKRVFNQDGLRVASFEMSFSTGLNGEIYDKKTGKLLVSFKSNPYQSGFSAEYFKGGERIQSRNSRGYSYTDTFYAEDGNNIVYQQFWIMAPGKIGEPHKPVLREIHAYNKEKQVAKIYSVEDGKVVRVSTPIDKQLILVKYLDPDGLVLRSETKKGNEVVAFDIPDVPKEREVIDNSWLQRITPVDVETYTFRDADSPPWLYDYEDTRFKGLI